MDILDILLDILLKTAQSFIDLGLFLIFQTSIQVLKWSVPDGYPDS